MSPIAVGNIVPGAFKPVLAKLLPILRGWHFGGTLKRSPSATSISERQIQDLVDFIERETGFEPATSSLGKRI